MIRNVASNCILLVIRIVTGICILTCGIWWYAFDFNWQDLDILISFEKDVRLLHFNYFIRKCIAWNGEILVKFVAAVVVHRFNIEPVNVVD